MAHSSLPDPEIETLMTPGSGQTLQEMLDDFTNTGSGSGLPLLVQRTIARQIALIDTIGRVYTCTFVKCGWVIRDEDKNI